jgi:hypothetical protein
MKLFYFYPNDYGLEFFTIASSEEEAIQNLNSYLLKSKYPKKDYKTNESLTWSDDYFKGYSIKVSNPGEVIVSEIS